MAEAGLAEEHFDVVVIGGGTAGLVTAAVSAGLGAKTALVEKHLSKSKLIIIDNITIATRGNTKLHIEKLVKVIKILTKNSSQKTQ